MTFKYRGHNTFYYARKRFKLPSLRVRRAEILISIPFTAGSINTKTGDGEAWHMKSYRQMPRHRTIKAGKWFGPWRYVKEYQDD